MNKPNFYPSLVVILSKLRSVHDVVAKASTKVSALLVSLILRSVSFRVDWVDTGSTLRPVDAINFQTLPAFNIAIRICAFTLSGSGAGK